jgi:hypothetical protein
MSTAPPVTPAVPAPKQSWLKRFGQSVWHFLSGSLPADQKIIDAGIGVAETFFPQFAPEIEVAKNWFDKGVNLILLNESTFAAVGQAANGPAKFQAVLAGISNDFDAWVTGNFPGGAQLVKAEEYVAAKSAYLQQYINETVAFMNKFQSTPAVPTASSVAAASAAQAAVLAKAAAAKEQRDGQS